MKNFLPLAIAQNEAQWRKQAPVQPTAIDARLEARAHQRQAEYLAARRARIVAAIAECREFQPAFLNHRYLRNLHAGNPMSSDEAVAAVLYEIAREKRRPTYCRDPKRIEDLREALVFARFFRRNSRRIWSRRIAA